MGMYGTNKKYSEYIIKLARQLSKKQMVQFPVRCLIHLIEFNVGKPLNTI